MNYDTCAGLVKSRRCLRAQNRSTRNPRNNGSWDATLDSTIAFAKDFADTARGTTNLGKLPLNQMDDAIAENDDDSVQTFERMGLTAMANE